VQLFIDILMVGYIVLYASIAAWCIWLRTPDTVTAFIFLSAIFYGIWNHNLWSAPQEMLSFHILILAVMALTPKDWFWRLFFVITTLMLIADGFWMAMPEIEPWLRARLPEFANLFPYHTFWWQSTLYLLFSSLCVITGIMNYYTHRKDKSERKPTDGYIWAKIGDLCETSKGHLASMGHVKKIR